MNEGRGMKKRHGVRDPYDFFCCCCCCCFVALVLNEIQGNTSG